MMRPFLHVILAVACLCPALPGQARLGMEGEPIISLTLNFYFTAPNDGGAWVMGALSFGKTPGITIPPPDGRTLPLNPDPLFFASMANPIFLPGFYAPLDAQGRGKGSLKIPGVSALIGLRIFAAYFTFDPVHGRPPWYVKSISNPVEFEIRPPPLATVHLAASHWRSGNNISLFNFNGPQGLLTPASTPTHASGGTNAYGVETLGKRLFVANFQTDDVSSLELNTSGGLTHAPGSPFKAGGVQTILCRHYKGLLFATHEKSNDITVYRVAPSSGALSSVAGSPFPAGGADPGDMVVVHERLYVALALSDAVNGFDVNLQTGALKKVASSAPGQVFAPWALATGYGFLFAGNVSRDSITVYEVNHLDGSLTPVPGSPFANPGKAIETMVFRRGYLFTTNRKSDSISIFHVDPHSGALTPARGSPVSVGKVPIGLLIHDDKLLVGNNGSGSIDVFRINFTSGALSPVPGSPFKDPLGLTCHLGVLY